MDKKTIITESYLQKHGFQKDECAPECVNRWYKKQKGYQSYYVTVTFQDGEPYWIFMRRTNYNASGALCNTETWDAKGFTMTIDDLLEGAQSLGIEL
ncbi:MAG: hypothetical protein J6V72_00650 [Kiritimatiellae bacterium]|nr:hypothetical protein [Kiritimatiellia bacterium]